jgi:hypothetical protein
VLDQSQVVYVLPSHDALLFERYSGFPANASDGFIGNPKMHELNVGCARTLF